MKSEKASKETHFLEGTAKATEETATSFGITLKTADNETRRNAQKSFALAGKNIE